MSIANSLKATGVADVIVVLKGAKEKGALAAATIPAQVARHFKAHASSQDAALLEMLKSSGRTMSVRAAAGRTSAASAAAVAPTAAPVRFYPNLGVALGTVDRDGLAGLRKEEAVRKIVPAPQLRLIKPVAATAAKAQAGYTWGIKALKVDQLHAQGFLGQGVIVGHLDTGVDASHPALKGAIKAYAEFDSLGAQVPNAKPKDSGEHGTHTAGTIAGRPVKSVRFGVAPQAVLASAMVIEGGNVTARILGGMNWAVGQGIRVLSMSLGLIGTKDDFLALTQLLRARGVLPVFAVGNEGPGVSRYPGNYAEALSVGASDSTGAVADFSGSQRFLRKSDPLVPDLVAPGVGVISCVPNNSYMEMDGTSMATPHIAGLAAVLMSARPNRTINEVEDAIFKSCSRTKKMTADRANRGLPDAVKALGFLKP
jgi:subtilisin family serine protease